MNQRDVILDCEKKLLTAIQNNDVESLEVLLHDDLLFIIPSGETVTKETDIAAYSSGKIALRAVVPSDYIIRIIHDTVVVSVNIEIKGEYMEHTLDNTFRYLRVWKLFDGNWKVIAGSCTAIG
ncbi:nuclear transport factor 2 family protein [Cytophaga hutchinsonii]|uniref:DUF4440 domain-containing protein n=2 Tax=Cytophaga hutchinsonii (strain ATCC 33406 / DSM 1761 / CIP 103989 / NBRC 15051 / NCIMB 9469 / D465) TaxID=269798 RepID=A0A6N4SQQ6_CYTH3|nr:nuclear transport factor 2 family protein [Cytophaga hutchinsonii]ABG58699.1 conserved hypothetical protein [Cytophaga hutchinsonii ATCC 33406]SFX59853.1 protein of unknown function [Cytophaga hutchinsonii ATCC 33406]